jgi:hypothetical protein
MENERSLVRAAPLARVALAGELDRGLRQRQVIVEAEALRMGGSSAAMRVSVARFAASR